jgi:hypothetical protein
MANREIWHELLVNTSPERLYEAVAKVKDWRTGGPLVRAEIQRSESVSSTGSMTSALP